jgi:hypothetical protein
MQKIVSRLVIAFSVASFSGLFVSTLTEASVASAQTTASNNLVFAVPAGPDGIEIVGLDGPTPPRGGPTAFTIGPNDDYWILESRRQRIHHYSAAGKRLPVVNLPGGGRDLEVDADGFWLLNANNHWDQVTRLDRAGTTQSEYPLRGEGGNSGLLLAPDGQLYLEWAGGLSYRLSTDERSRGIEKLEVNSNGGPDVAATDSARLPGIQRLRETPHLVSTNGITFAGRSYYLDETGRVVVGQHATRLPLPSETEWKNIRMERVLDDGRVFLSVGYGWGPSIREFAFFILDAAGTILESYHDVPNEEQVMNVPHPFGVSSTGAVYYVVAGAEQVEVRRLRPDQHILRFQNRPYCLWFRHM